MIPSLKPGNKPLISKELADLLADPRDEDITTYNDEFDKIISETNLEIKHFDFWRDLDVAIFILNNSRIIQRRLSAFPELEKATDYDLLQYQGSDFGIHWPDIDVDLSLRGFLMEEAVKLTTV